MSEPSFQLQMTADVANDLTTIPETAGVYVLLWVQDDTPQFCEQCKSLFDPDEDADVVELVPLYIGASGDSLRARIKSHVLGDARSSSFRGSLGLIMADRLDLKIVPIPTKTYFCVEPERRLSDWIVSNTVVGFYETDDPFGLEKIMLAAAAGKLNISGRSPTDLSIRLKELRSSASGRYLPIGW